ncbi:glycosyltransferase family 1 protein [Massilia sp. YIM B02763]|uniref:glycosyltransferase family 4 protein n=1 Tax=Massilia sp. YIM B02763 TaxID=3050130 RepID=UPI0025B64809|nr:glycosyltransferase family 1 protein [Massilia sp. YIM B02763]MDN4055292.1 glycosyltransferase family 1 protein [Massilia sp. YIM B02763]
MAAILDTTMNAQDATTPVRVGIGTSMIEPALTGGHLDGIGVYTQALLRHLPQAGCAISTYSWPRGGAPLTMGQAMPQSFERASLLDLVTPGAHRVHMPVDVFHVTDYRVVRMDCPVVASLHDALPIKHPEWCNPRLRGLKNWLQRKAAQKADRVIALSHYAIDELVECFGVDERRITVVPCGVDDDWFDPPAAGDVAATLAANGLHPGYFLFVGTLQPRKNVGRLLDAYLALPAAVRAERQLVIVGHAGARSEDVLRRIAAAKQDGANVVWLNKLTDNGALRHIYAGAGVFVFASLYEGFGIPVVEAFASGVPVVSANTTSLPEVSQGAALEVDPLDSGAIADAMLALAREPLLRARCITAGRARAAQLTWDATARMTAAVYRSLL